MKIKQTVSQIALGLAVVGIGAAASAFTNQEIQQGRFLTNNGPNYSDRMDLDGDCLATSTKECAYEVTSPENVPIQPTHTDAQVNSYLQNNWIEPIEQEGTFAPN
ncbi:hypothetical protein H8S90_15190 [Olivibacter sp. SDN3]|uniref:hypothetical protein n=1 Tax=Olivibacter sp. SDN3 TaxID=2764720 RepID=UPI0016515CA4|nr:hypothetical protein [Olivibacter sp. SDN3]QNL48147.1 hypothetical protein H8S90_15190 [Olivibacter sp. SDN3]